VERRPMESTTKMAMKRKITVCQITIIHNFFHKKVVVEKIYSTATIVILRPIKWYNLIGRGNID
jgi:hypothetical protein